MLREIYPKGIDFNEVKASEIQRSVPVINQRPRQILDYVTGKYQVFLYLFFFF
ncbi:MAG: hypothetical protein ACTTHM_06430 [Peptoanaerobacter stomatis]|uniref:hypothetical protein n=1 Tax=Peptoanaerobacter stomatis TaxID=796937 RepID=UPI003F9F6DAF